MSIQLEVCVDSPEGLAAAVGGADRIEICSALELGGLTPSPGLIGEASKLKHQIPIYAMIRPRLGDFSYSQAEIQSMELDIDAVREANLNGIVFGANRSNIWELDDKIMERLARRAQGMGMTLHRSFDLVNDLTNSIELAVKIGFERILTSGRAVRATDASAIEDLSKSVQIASSRISIMPGSGINSKNVTELLKNVKGIFEIHSSCSIAEIVDKEAAKLIEFGFCNKIIKKTNQEEVRRLKERLKAFDQMSL